MGENDNPVVQQGNLSHLLFYVCLCLQSLSSFCVSFVLIPIWDVNYLSSQPPLGWRVVGFVASIGMGLTTLIFHRQLVEYTMFGARRSWRTFLVVKAVGACCTASGLVMYYYTPVTALGCTLIICGRSATLALFMIFGNVALHNPTTPNFEILQYTVKGVGSYTETLGGYTTSMRFFARSMWWEGIVTLALTSLLTYPMLLVRLGQADFYLEKHRPIASKVFSILGITAKLVILLVSFIQGVGTTTSLSNDVGDFALFIFNGCFTALSLFVTVFAFLRRRQGLQRAPSLLGSVEAKEDHVTVENVVVNLDVGEPYNLK